jgi:predicted HTH domain antitoxin
MSALTTLEISRDILDSARLTVDGLKVEIAVNLYAQGRLSVGKARELAGMSLLGISSVAWFSPHPTTL